MNTCMCMSAAVVKGVNNVSTTDVCSAEDDLLRVSDVSRLTAATSFSDDLSTRWPSHPTSTIGDRAFPLLLTHQLWNSLPEDMHAVVHIVPAVPVSSQGRALLSPLWALGTPRDYFQTVT